MDETNAAAFATIESFVQSERRYLKSLEHEDDLGVVVRTQTYLESYVERMIDAHFVRPVPDEFFVRLSYGTALELAVALGELDAADLRALKLLAQIRNRFAHDPHKEITRDEINGLFGSLAGLVKERAQKSPLSFDGITDDQSRLRTALDAMRFVIDAYSIIPSTVEGKRMDEQERAEQIRELALGR
jgi:hypothetical protein